MAGKAGARGVPSKQGIGWKERKAGSGTHQDTAGTRRGKKNTKEGWGENDEKLGRSISKSRGKQEDVRGALGGRREWRLHGGSK